MVCHVSRKKLLIPPQQQQQQQRAGVLTGLLISLFLFLVVSYTNYRQNKLSLFFGGSMLGSIDHVVAFSLVHFMDCGIYLLLLCVNCCHILSLGTCFFFLFVGFSVVVG
jgi:hypothetical protein